MQKTHRTACAILPPYEVWEPIQAIREKHDRQIRRWMPHINVLYPFVPQEDFDRVEPLLREVCAGIDPFEVTLAGFDRFHHGRGKYTMWLIPTPKEPLVELESRLREVVPHCDEQSRHSSGFTPHLSVGQLRGFDDVREFTKTQKGKWQPVKFVLDEIYIIERGAPPDDVFHFDRTIPLGAADSAT